MGRREQLHEKVSNATATLAELEEYFGTDLMNQMQAQVQDKHYVDYRFIQWYLAVMEPLGMSKQASYDLFTGKVRVAEFVSGLTDDQLDNFLEDYEQRQGDYQRRLEAEGFL